MEPIFGYEVDYIPVSEGENAGDAIVIRYGNLAVGAPRNEQVIIVIDGGTKKSGKAIVEHIQTRFQTNKVDYIFSTHLDRDHLSGLTVVLEELEVDTLFMHIPWEHCDETIPLFNGEFTNNELEQELKESLELVHEVEALALEKGVSIEEPFVGTTVNKNLFILGPTKEYYEQLLPQFRETPKAKSALEEAIEMIEKAKQQITKWLEDNLNIELLNDDEKTSAENNSSLVLLFVYEDKKLLFTGDAGIPALTAVADLADSIQLSLADLRFLHVPHHGSKHNLGRSIVKRIKAETALVSGAKEGTKHPAKKITNALKKQKVGDQNTKVVVVRDTQTRHGHNAPYRENWGVAPEEPFHDRVEE